MPNGGFSRDKTDESIINRSPPNPPDEHPLGTRRKGKRAASSEGSDAGALVEGSTDPAHYAGNFFPIAAQHVLRYGGPRPSLLRAVCRVGLTDCISVLYDIAKGAPVARLKGSGGREMNVFVSAQPSDRLKAVELLLKYGLGPTVTVTDTEGQDLQGRTEATGFDFSRLTTDEMLQLEKIANRAASIKTAPDTGERIWSMEELLKEEEGPAAKIPAGEPDSLWSKARTKDP